MTRFNLCAWHSRWKEAKWFDGILVAFADYGADSGNCAGSGIICGPEDAFLRGVAFKSGV